ncbi:MAG TPA: META domain-containing protein [Acidimicrobiia bacterium]|nr:META domain-containing protein [Acidimicrobiia bacterium]
MRTRAPLVMLSLVLVVGLAACGDDDVTVGSGSSTTAPPPGLDGRTFIAQSVTEDGAPRALVAGTEIRFTFRDGTLGASAGCNTLGADYTIDGGVLRIDSVSTTEMGCDEPRHDQDSWLAAFLESRPAVTVAGDELTLANATTTIALLDREVADPDRPLEGTTWVLDTVIDGDAVSSGPIDEQLTLTIADGALTATLPCNELSAVVEVGDDQVLRLTDATSTAVACTDDALRALEDHMVRTLAGAVDYEIEADVLTLTNGALGLGYRAAAE